MTNKIFKIQTTIFLYSVILCFSACNGKKEKTFEEQAMKLIEETRKRNRIENEKKLKANNFSEGVNKVINWFDYEDPIFKEYSNSPVIKTNLEFETFNSSQDPRKIKALTLESSKDDSLNVNLSKYVNLEYLKLQNFKDVPEGFYDLMNLKVFIGTNELDIVLSSKISNLQNLEYFQSLFSRVKLPKEIGDLENLKTLILYNFAYEHDYSSIYNLSDLETLCIRYSSEENLKGISKLTKLKTLVTNKVTSEISKLDLTGLILKENQDTIYPSELGNINSLVAFYWQGNNTKTTAPEFVSNLKNIEYLEYRGCSEFNEIPIEYDNLNELQQFDIIQRPRKTIEIKHLVKIKDKIQFK